MSRKYYEMIASILRNAEISAEDRTHLIKEFSRALKADNAAFKPERFAAAATKSDKN